VAVEELVWAHGVDPSLGVADQEVDTDLPAGELLGTVDRLLSAAAVADAVGEVDDGERDAGDR
jgi:hypothetical protein